MYATRAMTQAEITLVKKNTWPGFLGHSVVGHRNDGSTSIETDSEVRGSRRECCVHTAAAAQWEIYLSESGAAMSDRVTTYKRLASVIGGEPGTETTLPFEKDYYDLPTGVSFEKALEFVNIPNLEAAKSCLRRKNEYTFFLYWVE